MTTISLPPGFDDPVAFSLQLMVNQRVHSSPFGGSEQVIDMLNDRWTATVAVPARTNDEAAIYEAFIGSLRGMVNTINLFHLVRPIPRGTMRGTPTCQVSGQGDGAMVLHTGQPGCTLLAGDMFGVSGLLLQVASDVAADGSGVMVVTLVNRLRKQIANGSAITWDRPTAPFRLMSTPAMQHVPGWAEGVSLDFAEVIL
jgi:hypothetical protein